MWAFPLVFGIIAVSNNFVPLFFGQGYEKVKILMKIMSFIILFVGLSNIIGSQYLLSTKNQKQYTLSVILGALVNVIFNSILIRFYQSIGAVIATVIAECVVTSVQFFFIRREFNIWKIIKLSKNYLISALIMFVMTIIIDIIVKSNMLGIILQVVFGGIIYFVILLIEKDNLILELKTKFLSKIRI